MKYKMNPEPPLPPHYMEVSIDDLPAENSQRGVLLHVGVALDQGAR